MLGYLQDMTQSLEFISKAAYKHINNKHKNLKSAQVKDLEEIRKEVGLLFDQVEKTFDSQKFSNIVEMLNNKKTLFEGLDQKIAKQISRTKAEESSPKNTALILEICFAIF